MLLQCICWEPWQWQLKPTQQPSNNALQTNELQVSVSTVPSDKKDISEYGPLADVVLTLADKVLTGPSQEVKILSADEVSGAGREVCRCFLYFRCFHRCADTERRRLGGQSRAVQLCGRSRGLTALCRGSGEVGAAEVQLFRARCTWGRGGPYRVCTETCERSGHACTVILACQPK